MKHGLMYKPRVLQELRQMERLQAGSLVPPSLSRLSIIGIDAASNGELVSQLQTENQALQRKCERLQKKEKRIMVLMFWSWWWQLTDLLCCRIYWRCGRISLLKSKISKDSIVVSMLLFIAVDRGSRQEPNCWNRFDSLLTHSLTYISPHK